MEYTQTNWQPYGAQAGAIESQKVLDAQKANQLSLENSALSNIVKQRDAAFAQDEMGSQDLRDSRLAGMIGQNQSLEAKGKFDIGTLDSGMKARIKENMLNADKADVAQTMLGLDTFIAKATSNGPIGMQQALKELPPQYQQVVQKMEQTEPGSSIKFARSLRDTLTELQSDNAGTRSKIKETEATGKWHKAVTAMQGANALALEKAQFEHGKYNKGSKLTLVESLVKNGNYERAATALSLMAMDMPDGPEKEKYLEQAAVYEGLAKDKAAAGKYNPSGVDTAGVTDLPRQQQTPSRLAPPKQGTAENPIKLK